METSSNLTMANQSFQASIKQYLLRVVKFAGAAFTYHRWNPKRRPQHPAGPETVQLEFFKEWLLNRQVVYAEEIRGNMHKELGSDLQGMVWVRHNGKVVFRSMYAIQLAIDTYNEIDENTPVE